MPVYNEAECIAKVVASWRYELAALRIDFRMIVLNDGSRDGTAEALAAFAGDSRIEIVNKPNAGHGPTILMGYRKAAAIANWVFQCDSDDEMPADHFRRLWARREQFDAVIGIRAGRSQGLGRKLISKVSRLAVWMLYGRGVADVNVPYRLIRAEVLAPLVERIPSDTFAPNVIISGALARGRCRIANVPVPHQGRRTGTVSIMKWKLWRSAFLAFRQTIRCRKLTARSAMPNV